MNNGSVILVGGGGGGAAICCQIVVNELTQRFEFVRFASFFPSFHFVHSPNTLKNVYSSTTGYITIHQINLSTTFPTSPFVFPFQVPNPRTNFSYSPAPPLPLIQIDQQAIDSFILSRDQSEWNKLSQNHGVKLPLKFDSPLQELNLLAYVYLSLTSCVLHPQKIITRFLQ